MKIKDFCPERRFESFKQDVYFGDQNIEVILTYPACVYSESERGFEKPY